jgi:hypothetical protein
MMYTVDGLAQYDEEYNCIRVKLLAGKVEVVWSGS